MVPGLDIISPLTKGAAHHRAAPFFILITMEQLNKVELRGNVGAVRIQNVGDRKVARLTVATNIVYRGQDGCCVIETTWHNVTAFDGKDINLDNLEKGARVEITGRLRNQRYTTADGEDRYSTEILANKVAIIEEPLTMQQ